MIIALCPSPLLQGQFCAWLGPLQGIRQWPRLTHQVMAPQCILTSSAGLLGCHPIREWGHKEPHGTSFQQWHHVSITEAWILSALEQRTHLLHLRQSLRFLAIWQGRGCSTEPQGGDRKLPANWGKESSCNQFKRNYKQPKCPSRKEWINKLRCVHTGKYYAAAAKGWTKVSLRKLSC